jgi:hypothetical protein
MDCHLTGKPPSACNPPHNKAAANLPKFIKEWNLSQSMEWGGSFDPLAAEESAVLDFVRKETHR